MATTTNTASLDRRLAPMNIAEEIIVPSASAAAHASSSAAASETKVRLLALYMLDLVARMFSHDSASQKVQVLFHAAKPMNASNRATLEHSANEYAAVHEPRMRQWSFAKSFQEAPAGSGNWYAMGVAYDGDGNRLPSPWAFHRPAHLANGHPIFLAKGDVHTTQRPKKVRVIGNGKVPKHWKPVPAEQRRPVPPQSELALPIIARKQSLKAEGTLASPQQEIRAKPKIGGQKAVRQSISKSSPKLRPIRRLLAQRSGRLRTPQVKPLTAAPLQTQTRQQGSGTGGNLARRHLLAHDFTTTLYRRAGSEAPLKALTHAAGAGPSVEGLTQHQTSSHVLEMDLPHGRHKLIVVIPSVIKDPMTREALAKSAAAHAGAHEPNMHQFTVYRAFREDVKDSGEWYAVGRAFDTNTRRLQSHWAFPRKKGEHHSYAIPLAEGVKFQPWQSSRRNALVTGTGKVPSHFTPVPEKDRPPTELIQGRVEPYIAQLRHGHAHPAIAARVSGEGMERSSGRIAMTRSIAKTSKKLQPIRKELALRRKTLFRKGPREPLARATPEGSGSEGASHGEERQDARSPARLEQRAAGTVS
ncbi:hypothetical protein IE81DRAFT_142272 [Ceraceosorus guamensis]|uniref:Uncharacterized protein n=1 Tax=Ceraceosorus guamensis TaxID=1522189 RepID=A0A316VZC3_9BASI|nr:hypothetical protein IE81DRAFT_142272 [Ceraceosorus guamensis]PWN42258.1 hypothetical protein IE81DRAFT_142272 [Ceraceosorus guamensis]